MLLLAPAMVVSLFCFPFPRRFQVPTERFRHGLDDEVPTVVDARRANVGVSGAQPIYSST